MKTAAEPAPARAPAQSYVALPPGWQRVRADGAGPFVTREIVRRPDGSEMRWESRAHRKRGSGRAADSGSVWWRPRRRNWWMAVLFVLGSLCFTAGGIAAQWATTSRPAIGITFFVGSLFFTSAAYLQYAEAVNAERAVGPSGRRTRWRPVSWEPRRVDWWAALVQLAGTVLFNISTFAAMNTALSTTQVDTRVWAPDAFGSIAFLIASELALAEVCHRWLCLRRRDLPWKIVALNLLGSITFGVSAVASLVEPASGQPVSAHVANAGTSIGGACFLLGALLLMPESASAERRALDARLPTAHVHASL